MKNVPTPNTVDEAIREAVKVAADLVSIRGLVGDRLLSDANCIASLRQISARAQSLSEYACRLADCIEVGSA